MTSTPQNPAADDAQRDADLAALREEIDELKRIPEEELISPLPQDLKDEELTAEPTDAIGSEKWDEPASEEKLDS